jgi:hypothetical protein
VVKTTPPQLDLDAIRSALAAISARFNLQEGQLSAEDEATRRAFTFLDEQFADRKSEALTGIQSDAAGRGILRSGLFLRSQGRTSEGFAKQRSQALSERDARLRGISTTLANLAAQEETEKVERARALATEQVGTAEAIARAIKLV